MHCVHSLLERFRLKVKLAGHGLSSCHSTAISCFSLTNQIGQSLRKSICCVKLSCSQQLQLTTGELAATLTMTSEHGTENIRNLHRPFSVAFQNIHVASEVRLGAEVYANYGSQPPGCAKFHAPVTSARCETAKRRSFLPCSSWNEINVKCPSCIAFRLHESFPFWNTSNCSATQCNRVFNAKVGKDERDLPWHTRNQRKFSRNFRSFEQLDSSVKL